MKIAFFKFEDWEKEHFQKDERLKKAGAELGFINEVLDKDHIPAAADFEIACVFIDSVINDEVLGKLPNLKFIATRSTGFDHIDLRACREKGVAVSNVPAYGENTVAEFTFALILVLSRKIYDAYNRVRETGSFNLEGLRGFDLKGKTLGVAGTGRIGRHVIKIAKGFEMNVVACDLRPDKKYAKELSFSYVTLEELLKLSDIVTLHVPYLKETHHFINSENIKLMKKGAYLINTSRGQVVETEALVKALKDKHLAGAALDVLEEEGTIKDELELLASGKMKEHDMKTILADHALIDMPNVIVTPHNAFNTREALERILETTIDNIVSFIEGAPKNTVS